MPGDEDPKPGGIPAWQRTHKTAPANAPDVKEKPSQEESPIHFKDDEDATDQPAQEESQAESSTSTSREELVWQAARFLQDDRLKDEPQEKKVEFLKSKGLQKEDVDRALELAKSTPSSVTESEPPPLPPNPPSIGPQTPLTPRAVPPPTPTDATSLTAATSSQSDVPPIITYPEFLIHSQKPPPIITASRLLNTAYGAAGIFAAIYGASKYLIQPMSETLTHSRHDFHEHALSQVEALNSKLGDVISVDASEVPPRHHRDPLAMAFAGAEQRTKDEDAASVDSDPTELYHRDFGTQTTEELLEKQRVADSSSSSSSERGDLDDPTAAAIGYQTRKLDRLKTMCKDLAGDAGGEVEAGKETSAVLKVLNDYLDSLAYPMGTYTGNSIYGGTAFGSLDSKGGKKDKEANDETGKIKAEIRALKGMLLSARNFPGAAANTSAIVSGGARAAAFPPAQTTGGGQ